MAFLRSENESLGESSEWRAVVGNLANDLHDDSVSDCQKGIETRHLGVAVFEFELADVFSDLDLSDDGCLYVKVTVNHLRVCSVEAVQKFWLFVQHCVVLKLQ